MISGKQLIAGSQSREGADAYAAIDPRSGDTLSPVFAAATEQEVDRACQAAKEAADSFAALAPAKRAQFLNDIASEIENLGEELLQRACQESALPEARITMERGRTCMQLRLFADIVREGSWVDARIDCADPARSPLPKPDVRHMRVALGPVAVFGASNFPLAFSTAGGDTASALAAGNPVLVKAHSAHPGTAELVGQAIQKAAEKNNLPAGVFALLHGSGRTVGQQLVKHPAIQAVGFTGSLAGGRALMDAAAARPHPIPVFAEMGSSNPLCVLPKALAERGSAIADGLAASVSLGVGQFCTKPGLIVLPSGETAEAFIQSLSSSVAACNGTMLTSGICKAYRNGLDERSRAAGITVVANEQGSSGPGQSQVNGAILRCSSQDFRANPELGEEIFGPFALVVTCADAADMEAVIACLPGQLTASLHGEADELQQHSGLFTSLAKCAGRVLCNGFPTGVEVCRAMVHGGPYPATSNANATSVGTNAMLRFSRPLCYQNIPQPLLPSALQDDNPLGIQRLIDGQFSKDSIA